MLEKVENSIKDLMTALQIARLYSPKHPEFMKFLDIAYTSLENVLAERQELVIGLIGQEIACGKEILFELSKSVELLINHMKGLGFEKIAFSRKMQKEELRRFLIFLITPKEKIGANPQAYLAMLGVENIVVGKIKAPSSFSGTKGEGSVVDLGEGEDFLKKAVVSLENFLNTEEPNCLAAKLVINGILERLMSEYQDFLKLATVKRYDNRVFLHLLAVSILSMYFSSKIGLAKDDVLDIGIAGLFHDIGKLYISRRILNKPAALTEEEFSRVKNHVTLGAEILLKYVDTLGILPAVVAFEHHIRYDLKGYPKVSFSENPHMASLIVSICDVYDAVFQRRSYKREYSPEMIYGFMLREKGRLFEPELLDKFFKIMGVWPIGTIACLSDQRIAVVRRENEDDIFSPQVEVIYPEDKKEYIDLRNKKGEFKIEYSLNPLKEGKDYLK